MYRKAWLSDCRKSNFKIESVAIDIHLNDVTDAFYQLSFGELPTKQKIIIVDGAITNFYY